MVQQVHESAVDAVAAERRRQDAKWGEQNHPDGTGPYEEPVAQILGDYIKAERAADLAKGATDLAAERGDVTWADILLEEVFEALAEKGPLRLRAELVQVSAVAQQWVEAIDRQSGMRSTSRRMTRGESISRMTMWWTETTWIPFVESEDADITGPGHQDPETFAAHVNLWDAECNGAPFADAWDASHVSHQWIVATVNDLGEWSGKVVPQGAEGAIPVTTIWGLR